MKKCILMSKPNAISHQSPLRNLQKKPACIVLFLAFFGESATNCQKRLWCLCVKTCVVTFFSTVIFVPCLTWISCVVWFTEWQPPFLRQKHKFACFKMRKIFQSHISFFLFQLFAHQDVTLNTANAPNPANASKLQKNSFFKIYYARLCVLWWGAVLGAIFTTGKKPAGAFQYFWMNGFTREH